MCCGGQCLSEEVALEGSGEQGEGEQGRVGSKARNPGVGTGPLPSVTQVTPSRCYAQAQQKWGRGHRQATARGDGVGNTGHSRTDGVRHRTGLVGAGQRVRAICAHRSSLPPSSQHRAGPGKVSSLLVDSSGLGQKRAGLWGHLPSSCSHPPSVPCPPCPCRSASTGHSATKTLGGNKLGGSGHVLRAKGLGRL